MVHNGTQWYTTKSNTNRILQIVYDVMFADTNTQTVCLYIIANWSYTCEVPHLILDDTNIYSTTCYKTPIHVKVHSMYITCNMY